MLLLVVLVEPHYEINLLCKVYNVRKLIVSVPQPTGTTMRMDAVSKAKATNIFVSPLCFMFY